MTTKNNAPKFTAKEYNAVKNMRQFKFLPNGNIKLGAAIWSWSTLMGDYEYFVGGQVIKGTCGNCDACKESCYVRASYNIHGKSVIPSHAKNTLGLRENLAEVMTQLDRQITRANTSKNSRTRKIELVRLNQSGEIETDDQFFAWCELAIKHPETKFYIYTKMYDIVTPALLSGAVPENLVVLYSVWHEIGVKEYEQVEHLVNVKAFVYDDGQLNVTPDTYCRAYSDNGKLDHNITCDKCQKCFNTTLQRKIIGCKAH